MLAKVSIIVVAKEQTPVLSVNEQDFPAEGRHEKGFHVQY